MPGKSFQCPACERRYKWSDEIAGRRARCLCGERLRVPAISTMPAEVLAGQTDFEVKPGMPPEDEAIDHSQLDLDPLQPMRDVIGPIVTIGIASGIMVLRYEYSRRARRVSAADFAETLVMLKAGKLVVMVGFTLLMSWLIDTYVGKIGPAILKLAAICLLCDAICSYEPVTRVMDPMGLRGLSTPFYFIISYLGARTLFEDDDMNAVKIGMFITVAAVIIRLIAYASFSLWLYRHGIAISYI